jgi:hypothetical protein
MLHSSSDLSYGMFGEFHEPMMVPGTRAWIVGFDEIAGDRTTITCPAVSAERDKMKREWFLFDLSGRAQI